MGTWVNTSDAAGSGYFPANRSPVNNLSIASGISPSPQFPIAMDFAGAGTALALVTTPSLEYATYPAGGTPFSGNGVNQTTGANSSGIGTQTFGQTTKDLTGNGSSL